MRRTQATAAAMLFTAFVAGCQDPNTVPNGEAAATIRNWFGQGACASDITVDDIQITDQSVSGTTATVQAIVNLQLSPQIMALLHPQGLAPLNDCRLDMQFGKYAWIPTALRGNDSGRIRVNFAFERWSSGWRFQGMANQQPGDTAG